MVIAIDNCTRGYITNSLAHSGMNGRVLGIEVADRDVRRFGLVWLLAVLTYGVGDLLTTMAILEAPGLQEANALVVGVIGQYGQAGFVGVKLAAFLVAFGIALDGARAGDRVTYYLPPVTLVVFGVALTAYNLGLLVG
jgi:hypothetical protein